MAVAESAVPSFLRPTQASSDRIQMGTLSAVRRRSSGIVAPPLADGKGSRSRRHSTGVDLPAAPGTEGASRFVAPANQFRADCFSNESLHAVALFQQCSKEFVELLKMNVCTDWFSEGQEIIRQGDIGDNMYILILGVVEVEVNGTAVATLQDGAVFGEIAVLSKNPLACKRSATIRAKANCVCRRINRESLHHSLHAFPADRKVIEAQAQRRIQELKDKGILPKDREWWRPKEVETPPVVRGEPVRSELWSKARRLASLHSGVRRHSSGECDASRSSPSRERPKSQSPPTQQEEDHAEAFSDSPSDAETHWNEKRSVSATVRGIPSNVTGLGDAVQKPEVDRPWSQQVPTSRKRSSALPVLRGISSKSCYTETDAACLSERPSFASERPSLPPPASQSFPSVHVSLSEERTSVPSCDSHTFSEQLSERRFRHERPSFSSDKGDFVPSTALLSAALTPRPSEQTGKNRDVSPIGIPTLSPRQSEPVGRDATRCRPLQSVPTPRRRRVLEAIKHVSLLEDADRSTF